MWTPCVRPIFSKSDHARCFHDKIHKFCQYSTNSPDNRCIKLIIGLQKLIVIPHEGSNKWRFVLSQKLLWVWNLISCFSLFPCFSMFFHWNVEVILFFCVMAACDFIHGRFHFTWQLCFSCFPHTRNCWIKGGCCRSGGADVMSYWTWYKLSIIYIYIIYIYHIIYIMSYLYHINW